MAVRLARPWEPAVAHAESWVCRWVHWPWRRGRL